MMRLFRFHKHNINSSCKIKINNLYKFRECFFSSKALSLYSILNVPKNFTPDELKTARRTLSKKYHPDVNDGKEIQFLEIQKAAEILGDPIKRHDYDKMTESDLKRFELKWLQQYDLNKEKGKDFVIKINKYVKTSDSVSNFIERIVQRLSNKNNLMIYDQDKNSSEYSTGFFTHAHIILDASRSMYGMYPSDVGIKQILIRKENYDGIEISICDLPQDTKSKKLLETTKYMYTSIKAINDMLYEIISKNSLKYVSMKTFSSKEKIIRNECSPIELTKTLRQLKLEEYRVENHSETFLYDAIANSIDQRLPAVDEQSDKLSDTLFVVLTDGYDTGSMTSVDNLCKLIKTKKCINIVIISLDLTNTKDLQRIVDSAMFGKLLKVGDSFEFKTINEAFNATKDIVIRESIKIDITKTFNL
jgi:curved DNA-binding protein CbpA